MKHKESNTCQYSRRSTLSRHAFSVQKNETICSSILIRMTLLVAGFIIGPNGESVRAIVTKSGSEIHSCTKMIEGKECRVFFLEVT